MENFTNEQLTVAAKFYEKMGVKPEAFISGGEVKDIFSFLSFKPEVDEEGNRKLTPYEILGLIPNFDGEKERPIIFFIKNKVRNLKSFKLSQKITFEFSKEKNKSDNSLIEFLVKSYKSAIAQNNLAEADRQFDMLNKITGGKAKRYIGSGYDYTKFYRQMKKQLLIDLFSHFFLIYLMRKKSLIKKGLIIKNKKFVAFKQNKQQKEETAEMLPQIKSIRIDEAAMFEPETPKQVSELEETSENVNEMPKEVKQPQEKQEVVPLQRKSFIKRIKNKFFRKDKKKQQSLVAKVSSEPLPEPEKEVIYE